jgi:FkbM family methyltransferase
MNIKKIIPEAWKQKIKNDLGVPSHDLAFRNLKKCGFVPTFVLDIGAYEGEWTKSFLKVFPNTPILMIEAQEIKEEKLKKVCQQFPTVSYSIAVCSSSSNETVSFVETGETTSHVVLGESASTSVQKQATSLSDLLSAKKSPVPNFIKIDVQGHEIPVLQGAESFLSNVEIIMAEVTIMDLGYNESLLLEFSNFLDKYGFRVYDIAQFMRRPYDKALYQADFIFVNKNSDLIKDKSWA